MKHNPSSLKICALALAIVAANPIDAHSAAPTWKPNETTELIVGVSAGSAIDTVARLIQKILDDNKIVEKPVVVTNKPGGGQTVAMAYLANNARNPNMLFLGSTPLLTKKLLGLSSLTYTDFTPITQLFNGYMAFAVRSDSPIRTGKDLIDQVRKNPRAISIAGGNSLGNGYLALNVTMKEAGVNIRELRTVTFKGGSEATLAVLGGHVDVLVTLTANATRFLEDGKMRVLAVSSPRRLTGAYASVPTWKEQGVDTEYSTFSCVLGAGGIDPSQVAYWEEAFSRLLNSDQWKQAQIKNQWEPATPGHVASETYLKTRQSQIKAILTDLGLAKK